MAKVSILDENDIILGTRSWHGDKWDGLTTDLITAISEDEFTSVKVRLEFSSDQTVNYRGWELHSLQLFSLYDSYLDIQSTNTNSTPKIPMRINGIFPNPSFGKLQVNVDNYPGGSATLNIYNLLGQNILSKNINNLPYGKHYIELDLNNGLAASTGMYFIRIQTQKEQAVKKCIILKN